MAGEVDSEMSAIVRLQDGLVQRLSDNEITVVEEDTDLP